MKLWNKDDKLNKKIEKFTVGKDRIYDMYLAEYDIKATIAHAKMLNRIDILNNIELDNIISELNTILNDITNQNFIIEHEFEDIHSKIESILIDTLGRVGKKIHTVHKSQTMKPSSPKPTDESIGEDRPLAFSITNILHHVSIISCCMFCYFIFIYFSIHNV